MIAGETEYLVGYRAEGAYGALYADFFSKKSKDPAAKESRRKKRRAWWERQKEGFKELGGFEGLGGLLKAFEKDKKPEAPSDFKIQLEGLPNEKIPAHPKDKKQGQIPGEVWYIAGGLVLLGGLFLISKRIDKQKAAMNP